MSSPSDRWSPCATRRQSVLARRRYRRDARRSVEARPPAAAPLWWEPLVVLSLCSLLGWLSWYVAFGGWR